VIISGENGAGKTNLLEAVHLATQGFSPRTRADAHLVRFGEAAASVAVSLRHQAVEHHLAVRIDGGTRSVSVDGSSLVSTDALRRSFPTLVFTPDRLGVIKGGPAVRRAYFDRALTRLYPARSELPGEYAAAIGQRNAALRRVQLSLARADALAPWTGQVAALGSALVSARQDVLAALGPRFAEALCDFGLAGASLSYTGLPPTVAALERRLDSDIALGTTGLGPHRDDVLIEVSGRDLRTFGSQGQQRLAVLALLLSEAALVSGSPLVLLDDVLSELDERRRAVLAEHVGTLEQTLISATQSSAFPAAAAQVVEVGAGQAR
jgi:DNA replication and repair protein RecF